MTHVPLWSGRRFQDERAGAERTLRAGEAGAAAAAYVTRGGLAGAVPVSILGRCTHSGAYQGGVGMDPVTLIVAALVAGAAAGLKDTASSAIKDAYNGLRGLVLRRLA